MPSIEKQLVATSKALAEIIVASIGNNQDLFDETMEIVYRDTSPLSMRAAWIATMVARNYPDIASPHIEKIIKIVPAAKVDGVKRCGLYLLLHTPHKFSEEQEGQLIDITFGFIENPAQPIAVRAISIEILMKMVKKYPELKPELRAILESIMPDASNGLKNKCWNSLKKLNKK